MRYGVENGLRGTEGSTETGISETPGRAMDSLNRLHASDPELNFVRQQVAFRQGVADWCLRLAQRHIERGQVESALEWNYLAASALARSCRPLASETIERNLLDIASRLPHVEWHPERGQNTARRWLHVIDNALPYGGHTAMARRWIASDPGSVHSVALHNQQEPVPEVLTEAVLKSGGEIFLPDTDASLFSRANWLRQLAYAKADYVVLHVSNADVVSCAAFGVDGGPPVLMVNHAAHTFWTGTSVIDLVLNCRGSQLERYWTRQYRGVSNAATLPIPIPPPQTSVGGEVFTAEYRAQARQQLNLPADAVVLLSVGREEKYQPILKLNFFEVARSILTSSPQTRMLVVGPLLNEYREQLSKELNGRLVVVGCQSDLRPYYAAADVYMESFPFGSTTALLEAGVHGIPCVLAPGDCPPPYGTDGVAIDDELQRPANVKEYADRVKALIASKEERVRCGTSLARSIREHHCDAGWTRYLKELVGQIPEVHAVRPVTQPPSPPEEYDYFWTRCFSRFQPDPFVFVFLRALSFGLTPGLDLPMYRASRAASRARQRKGRLQATAPVVLSALLRLCPPSAVKPLHHCLMYVWESKKQIKSFLRRKSAMEAGSSESVVAI